MKATELKILVEQIVQEEIDLINEALDEQLEENMYNALTKALGEKQGILIKFDVQQNPEDSTVDDPDAIYKFIVKNTADIGNQGWGSGKGKLFYNKFELHVWDTRPGFLKSKGKRIIGKAANFLAKKAAKMQAGNKVTKAVQKWGAQRKDDIKTAKKTDLGDKANKYQLRWELYHIGTVAPIGQKNPLKVKLGMVSQKKGLSPDQITRVAIDISKLCQETVKKVQAQINKKEARSKLATNKTFDGDKKAKKTKKEIDQMTKPDVRTPQAEPAPEFA